MGPVFTEDQKKTGILASVSMAQFLLESAYGKSELAQNANNCFGMKKSLSGNSWAGSAWDGSSVYFKKTNEYSNGNSIEITAEFRKYKNIEDSIADHSAYLSGAKNGTALRYNGLKGESNYKRAAQIIKDGGYATSPTYVENLCAVIEKWDLTKFDVAQQQTEIKVEIPVPTHSLVKGEVVRFINRKATYTNGKQIPDWVINSGRLYVRDVNGDNITFSTLASGAITGVTKASNLTKYDNIKYQVKITANLLNVRTGPSVSYSIKTTIKNGEVYGIKQESNGWGLLDNETGWINLKYAKRV